MTSNKRGGTARTRKPTARTPARAGASEVRAQVRNLLSASPGYQALPPDRRKEIANNTVRVASYLVDPHGLMAQEFRNPLLAGVLTSGTRRRGAGPSKALSDGVQMSSAALDELVAAVDFPDFVSGLINGVFSSIVNASIQQMEAYASLVASVSRSVDGFAAENITDASARDALVDDFPDTFCWTGTRTRRLRCDVQAGSPKLARVVAAIGLREPVANPQQPAELDRIVAGARRRVARNRQQTLATMMLMGINRIVVTNGRGINRLVVTDGK